MFKNFSLCLLIVFLESIPSEAIFLIVPEDVPAGFAAIYGFAPPITKGNDHRIGFGFRLGNHADFQILYEFGPQTVTKPLYPPKIRSTSYRQRFARRRPVFELLVRAGILKKNSFEFNVIQDCDVEPR